jgi:hypothetical protein
VALGSYLFWGFIVGLVFVVLYAMAAAGTPEKRPELSEAVALFLAVNGVVASIRLFVVVFAADSLGVLAQTDRLYLAVGAIAAMWVSGGTIARTFAGLGSEEEEQAAPEDAE